MTKAIVFDMDGTLVDFYSVEGWKEYLETENVKPYVEAKPIYNENNMELLRIVIAGLKEQGWQIIINSWLSQTGSKAFKKQIIEAKKKWLADNHIDADKMIFTDYGTDKRQAIEHLNIDRAILVDDNPDVLKVWNGETIDANENIIPELFNLLEFQIEYEYAYDK